VPGGNKRGKRNGGGKHSQHTNPYGEKKHMTDREQLSRVLSSLKGLSGSGNVLPYLVSKIEGLVSTMEPGDFVRTNTNTALAVPVSADLWYLFYNDNLLKELLPEGEDKNRFNYSPYLDEYFSFLGDLPGLKPLKVLPDLEDNLGIEEGFGEIIPSQYQNNGIYWINRIAFELWKYSLGAQYPSDGPADYSPNEYVGYLSFPIGQLGVMEVISILQETALTGYQFSAVDADPDYYQKAAPTIEDQDKPKIQSPPQMFPDMKDDNGNALAGQNYCFGTHLIEGAYLTPETVKRDVELFSSGISGYVEDVKPKLWMRYWINRDSKLPVPGEFIGILCRPVAAPPHVWWFQESSPFVYAGNWMETGNLTSGVVTAVTDEDDRDDEGIGNLYTIKIQGCTVQVEATDFCSYAVGDRVALVKLDTILTEATKSFTWLDQLYFNDGDKDTIITNYVIAPLTFYKKITN
jgi:hypothetical protein